MPVRLLVGKYIFTTVNVERKIAQILQWDVDYHAYSINNSEVVKTVKNINNISGLYSLM